MAAFVILMGCLPNANAAEPKRSQGYGEIRGKVTDAVSDSSLAGAAVRIEGSGVVTTTDLHGDYTLKGVPPGKRTILVSLAGYRSTKTTLKVEPDQSENEEISLSPANNITSTMSAQEIQAFPETNAASAIGRMPGISIQRNSGEAYQVTIRGIQPQYNEVAIDNVPLASEGTNRAVDLSMINPYMLQSIEVYKTLTPDMNADAIGGYVNMELKEAPKGFHTDLMWQSGYVQKNDTYGNYSALASASDRFFGNKLGVSALFDAENYGTNSDNMTASYNTPGNGVQVNTVSLDRHIETRQRYGADLVLDYRLPHGSLRSVDMFSRLNSNAQDYTESLDYSALSIVPGYSGGHTTQDLALNTLDWSDNFGGFSVHMQAANTYSLKASPHSSYGTFLTGGIREAAPVNVPPEDLVSLIDYYQTRNTYKDYVLGMGLTSASYRENDEQLRGDIKVPLRISPEVSGYFKIGGMVRYNYRINALDSAFASGIGILPSTNSGVEENGTPSGAASGGVTTTNFMSSDPKLYAPFLDNRFGAIYWLPDAGAVTSDVNYLNTHNPETLPIFGSTFQTFWTNGPAEWDSNRWKYIERYYAAYLMVNLNVLGNLNFVGGLRYEDDLSSFAAFGVPIQAAPVYPVSSRETHVFVLPVLQARYVINRWLDVRGTFAETVRRPAYQETSPGYFVAAYPYQVTGGNPNLRPPRSYNEDIDLDFHNNRLGILSIDGFYKTITHFDYPVSYELLKTLPPGLIAEGFDTLGSFVNPNVYAGTIFNTYMNSSQNAYLRGVSFDYQTKLWYLPRPWNGLLLGINYTLMSSTAQYPIIATETIPNPPNPRAATMTLLDSSRTLRLLYQPNDVMNAYVGYIFKGFSARVSFLLQGNTLSYIGSNPEEDGYTSDYFRIDAEVTQELPWKGFEVYFEGENLTGAPDISAQNSIGALTAEQYYGFNTYIGIRYSL